VHVTTAATVRDWHAEDGWGVLDSDATPGGCWTHFSNLDFDGYRSLSPGQQVELTAEAPGQDGYPWRAVRVSVDGRPPAVATQGLEGAYQADLTVVSTRSKGRYRPSTQAELTRPGSLPSVKRQKAQSGGGQAV
jgi:CspA family cold shock protein